MKAFCKYLGNIVYALNNGRVTKLSLKLWNK